MQSSETTWMLASKQMFPFELREIETEPVWAPIALERYVCWIEKRVGLRVFQVPYEALLPTFQDEICLDTMDLDVTASALQKAVSTAHARSNIAKWQNGELTTQDLRATLVAAITVEDCGVELRTKDDAREKLETLARQAGECFDLEVRDESEWEEILTGLSCVPDEITDDLDALEDEDITDDVLYFTGLTRSDLDEIAYEKAWEKAQIENEDKTRSLIARDIQLLFDARHHAILTSPEATENVGLLEARRALNWVQFLQSSGTNVEVELMSGLLDKLCLGTNDATCLMTQSDDTQWDQLHRKHRIWRLNSVVSEGAFSCMRFDRTTPWVVGCDFDNVHALLGDILKQLCGPHSGKWNEQTQAQLLAHLITRDAVGTS